jgi:hypothetical protein
VVLEALKIRWTDTIELVPITNLDSGKEIVTRERWTIDGDSFIVSYKAIIIEFVQGRDKYKLRLTYDKSKQSDPEIEKIKEELIWGVSTIRWTRSTESATAEWTAHAGEDPGWNGEVSDVKFIYSNDGLRTDRTSGSASRVQRPGQRQLREDLLLYDGVCALTGETETAVLDVAHVVPVQDEGEEKLDNTILLRADIHRLYDERIFHLVASNGKVVLNSRRVSQGYSDLLAGKRLPSNVFRRVKGALKKTNL